jgi:NADPH-dependent curcumin reductase CurA
MNEDTGVHYMTPWKIGEEAGGFGGLGQVVKSADPEFSPGDILESQFGWPWVAYFKQRQNAQAPLRKVMYSLKFRNFTLNPDIFPEKCLKHYISCTCVFRILPR